MRRGDWMEGEEKWGDMGWRGGRRINGVGDGVTPNAKLLAS